MHGPKHDGGPRLKPFQWILRSKYHHMATLLAPSLTSDAVAPALVERLQRRLNAAKRLNSARRVFFLLIYTAAVAPAVLAIVSGLASSEALTRLTTLILSIAIILGASIGVLAVAFLTRTLGIIEVELHLLAVEAGIQRAVRSVSGARTASSDVVGPKKRGRK